MTATLKRIYEFDSFRVDVAERQVFRDGEILVLTPKVFDILVVLLENRGNTVEKDDLIRQIWPDTYVEEGSLNRNISTLRKALGDDSNEQKFIKTLPKRGYRFTAQVDEFTEETANGSETTATKRGSFETGNTAPETRSRRHTRAITLVIAVATGCVLIGVLVWTFNYARKRTIDFSVLPLNERRQLEKYASFNHEAYEDYVIGRSLWHRRSAEGLHNSILHLERAVSKDPGFALAHTALGDAYAFDVTRWKDAESRAREAIRLESKLGEPYATIGFVRMFWEWKLAEAGESYRTAIELAPHYATAHQWYAINLIAARSGGAALAEMRRAVELEPQSVAIGADLCQLYYFLEKYDDAIMQCRKTLEADPDFLNAHVYLYEIYSAREMSTEAVDAFFKIERLKSDFALPFSHQEKLRVAFSQGGIRAFWKTRLEYLEQNPHFYELAKYYARLGENEKAIWALRNSAEKRNFDFVFFQTEPVFRGFRDEPAFVELERFLGGDLKP